MADIRLIATDLDGTFLLGGNLPHPENVQAVRACHQMGINVCACTGRSYNSAKEIILVSGLDRYCVLNNGASIMDMETGTLRYRNRFRPQTIGPIVEVLLGYGGAHFSLTGFETLYLLESHVGVWYGGLNDALKQKINAHIFKTKEELVRACQDDVERINLDLPFLQTFDDLSEKLAHITPTEITASGQHALEITNLDGNKSHTLMLLADIYDVQPENVMAVGDSFNDIKMIAWAGTGVAMGNADQRVKDMADFVTDTNVDAGFAKAVYRIALAGKRPVGRK